MTKKKAVTKKRANEITVWVGRDGDGDFDAGSSKAKVEHYTQLTLGYNLETNFPTGICRKHGLALGLHRIVKKGEVARVTFTAKAVK